MSSPKVIGVRDEVGACARELAHRAGDLQLSRLGHKHDIREKAPRDPVTEVDLLCEELLVSAIRERYPEDAILSEERGGKVSEKGRTWLLDPLDGTANYARGFPLFCCCVSVIEDGVVTHAAVSAPRLGDLYHASLGGGAWLKSRGATERLRVSGTVNLGEAFVGADSAFHDRSRKREPGPKDRLYDRCWQIRALGSAGVRGGWIAAGHLDLSVGTTNTPWDYAPTALLVSEAGGRVSDLAGEPWTLASEGMAATNGHLHGEVLAALGRR